MRKAAHGLGIVLALCLLLFGAFLASAQEVTPAPTEAAAEATAEAPVDATPEVTETPITDLTYNRPVVGRIDNVSPSQDWPLSLDSADRLTIIVERLDGNLIPNVVLLNAAGSETGSRRGAEPNGATTIIDAFAVPEAGDYTVRVERDRGANGQTQGRYQLTVIQVAAAFDAAANADVVGPIEPDEPVESVITADHWYHRYTYRATATDSIVIVAERTGGNLEPLVHILNPDGSPLTSGYVGGSGDLAATNRVNLPAPGDYTIVVTRGDEFNDRTQGSYVLTLRLIGSGVGSPALAGVAGDVTYGEAVDGEITPARWYEDWTLTVNAADTITMRVQRADDANLQPEVALLGGSGQEIVRGYTSNTGDSAEIVGRTLDGPGEYTLRVSRSGGQTGESAGVYTLIVELIGSGASSPALQGTTGTVVLGQTVEGEVTNERWADSWVFNATAGERVQVTVERTGGTLIPRLQMRDRNGQPLSDAYAGETGDIATLQYTSPSTGEFRIAVMRDRDQGGVTSGAYELTVAPVE